MERKFGKYAIPNLPLIIVIIYGFGFLMNLVKPEWIYFITLNPEAIIHGQVWRLVSWIFVPDSASNVFFVLIFLFFYYSIGKNLEIAWGKFAFNFFFFMGIFLTIIGAFLLFGYFKFIAPDYVANLEGYYTMSMGKSCPASLGIIPIKVKVLGIIYVIVLGVSVLIAFVQGGFNNGIITLVAVSTSLINVLIFYLLLRKGKKRFKEIKRQKEFKKKIKAVSEPVSAIRHKCAVCGQTDVSNPSLTFRYCSKCNGNYEYCNEHLFTHKHIE